VLAGIVILAGTVAASSVRRGREVALLKTLGMTRAGVVAVFAVEYALIGWVAGIVGSLGAGVLAWVVVTRGMELEWSLAPWPFAATWVGVVAVTVLAGIAASWRALSRPPLRELGGVP
jgi:putative ABC transport system permease protein